MPLRDSGLLASSPLAISAPSLEPFMNMPLDEVIVFWTISARCTLIKMNSGLRSRGFN